jgi:hypothetical protein
MIQAHTIPLIPPSSFLREMHLLPLVYPLSLACQVKPVSTAHFEAHIQPFHRPALSLVPTLLLLRTATTRYALHEYRDVNRV